MVNGDDSPYLLFIWRAAESRNTDTDRSTDLLYSSGNINDEERDKKEKCRIL